MKKLILIFLFSLVTSLKATIITVINNSKQDIRVQLQLQGKEGSQPKEAKIPAGKKIKLSSGFNNVLFLDWSYLVASDISIKIFRWRGRVSIPKYSLFKTITIQDNGKFLDGDSLKIASQL